MHGYKLGIRIGRPDMVERFQHSGRIGFHLADLQEEDVAAGDSLEFIARDTHGITVADIANLFMADATNQDLLRRASDLPALPEGWRGYFRARLWGTDA